MSNHDSFPYATDQNAEHHEQHPASFTGHADSPHASSLLSSVLPSQTGSLSASPQLRVPSVAPINTSPAPSNVSNLTLAPSSEIFYSSTVTHQADCAVYTINQTEAKVMEQKVRQFYAADGASFIEHVPGHCLVFIPNTTNVDYVLHELRKIRQPRRRNRAPKDKSNKPTNAFIKYRNHKIVELKRMHPEISQTEISRMAGECWRTEPEELKEAFRRKYQEEKRVYDMNKAKNAAAAAATTESEIGSDGEALSDTLSSSSMSVPGRASATPHIETPGGPSINSLGLGFGLDGNPVGFNTGRRRSHTLPPGGFTRSGAKRRISQELRKHLANKKSSAYMAAASATCNGSMGVGAFADSMQVYPAQQSQQLLPPPPPYEFTFTAPQIDSSTCSSTIGGASPYMGGNTSGSPMLIPLNPNFPLADFTTQADPSTSSAPVHAMQNQHQHTRSLTSVSASLPLNASVFATTAADSGFGSLVSNPAGMSKSFTDSSVNGSLPMIDTSNLNVFANDGMSINAFSAGYLGSDPSPWPMTSAYTILPDSTSSSSTATSSIASAQLQQQQQDHAVQNYPSQSHHNHF